MHSFEFEFTTKSGNAYYAEVQVKRYKEDDTWHTEIEEVKLFDSSGELSEDHEERDELLAMVDDESYEVESETIWNSFYVDEDYAI
jgi:hypothetical protein